MFALVDCNNFYASCERVFRPDLNGKPIAVLSNNDGCVIARSNEAKALGIPMGAPAFQYEKEFKEKGVHVFSANFELYGDMSHRMMSLLEDFCPNIELYSIDEAFLKFDGFDSYVDLNKSLKDLHRRVTKGTGIPITIGVGPTKALSKVAAAVAKKFPKQTGGIYCLDTEEKIQKALKWLKVADVWGIGRAHTKRLDQVGVKTAYDFTQLNDSWIRKNMAIVGLKLKKDLQGFPTLDLEDVKPRQNIATTRSFEKNIIKKEELVERIATFTVCGAEKLRKQKMACQAMLVFFSGNRFDKDYFSLSVSKVVKLPFASNSNLELVSFASAAANDIFQQGGSYKRAGVILMDFIPENKVQLNLFENSHPKHQQLMQSLDAINLRFGQQKVRLAIQDQKRIWKMKQERLSPCYTTKLKDIITIHAR
jgi:DNA polymerase V